MVRWRWLILGCTVAGAGAGFVATRVIPPVYRAQATIWIDARTRAESGPAPFQAGRLFDPEAWLDLTRSYAVLDAVAREERLYLRADPDVVSGPLSTFAVTDSFRPGHYQLVAAEDGGHLLLNGEGVELDRAPPNGPLGVRLGFAWTPPAPAEPDAVLEFEVVTLRDAADQLAEQIQPHIDPEGNLLRLGLEGPDRDRLAAVLDRIAARYVAVAGELKREKLTELTGILATQLDSATRALVTAESTYQVFRAGTITLPRERPAAAAAATPAGGGGAAADPVGDRYFELVGTRAALRRDRAAIGRALGDGGGPVSVEALTSVPSARESRELSPALDELAAKETELRGLKARYSDLHPEVVRLSDQVRRLREETIPELARALAAELQVREGNVSGAVVAAASELRSIPARSLQEARLRRSVALSEDLYNTLQQRYDEARLAVASTIPDARILDRAAVPRYPARDGALRLFALALMGGLACGLTLAILLDRLDPRFRYPAQVSRGLGLPILGAIPHLSRKGGPAERAVAPLIEALRGVRMAITTAAGDAAPLTLAISSPGAGDGKSFVTSNLAFTFAEAGYRTLLIDGDIRRGRLHQQFSLERRPGLSDVLQDPARLSSALHRTTHQGLTVLPCGSRAHFAPELLGSRTMEELMAEVRGRFDVILCDTPPLTAGIDPFVLATLQRRLILVLRNGVSHREAMLAKLEVLQRMPIELLGVVMNDVPADATYGYFSYYLPGYEARDEGSAGELATIGR